MSRDMEPQRGKLKVFLGYAAGVGKTYQMLSEAQELRQQGIDVVIGYFEPHARAETIALTEQADLSGRFGLEWAAAMDSMELATGASPEWDHEAFLAAKQTPVFFGSGINNFGVQEILQALVEWAPPPQPRQVMQLRQVMELRVGELRERCIQI